jgi:hypothetical protein
MALAVAPLWALTQKGKTRDWTDLEQTAFVKAKQLTAQVGMGNFELDVLTKPTGCGWGLWQRLDNT